MTGKIALQGQQVFYNHEDHVLYVTIDEPFYYAGKKLEWLENSPEGLGFNLSIIKQVLDYKCNMVVKIGTEDRWYWIAYDKLKQFIENKEIRSDWILHNGTHLKVIPRAKFIPVPKHNEV